MENKEASKSFLQAEVDSILFFFFKSCGVKDSTNLPDLYSFLPKHNCCFPFSPLILVHPLLKLLSHQPGAASCSAGKGCWKRLLQTSRGNASYHCLLFQGHPTCCWSITMLPLSCCLHLERCYHGTKGQIASELHCKSFPAEMGSDPRA